MSETMKAREAFCAAFIARMMAVADPLPGSECAHSLLKYAEQAAEDYYDDPDQRDEGPDACADADISYWEEG